MTLDIGYIIRYIHNYDVGIPKGIILGGVVCMCGISVRMLLIKDRKPTVARNSSLTFLCLYVFLMLYITVVYRHSSGNSAYVLNPLRNYIILNNRIIAEIFLNIVMFIPVGFLACCALSHPNFWKTCKVGAGLSIAIELTQLFTERGICHISDVVHNTMGCLLGYVFCRLLTLHKND